MGKTSQPLRLLVHSSLEAHPKIQEIVAKGHFIETAESGSADLSRYDGVIGPNCWRLDAGLLDKKFLDVFLKGCRAAQKEKKKREKDAAGEV